MPNRKRRRIVKKKARRGRWIAAAVIIALAGVSGWWMLSDSTKPGAKRKVLDRMSVVVDRIDQLTAAWNSRSGPNYRGKAPGRNNGGREAEPRAGTPPASSSPAPAPEGNAPEAGKPESPKPDQEVSPDDQEQLRDLLHQINQNQ